MERSFTAASFQPPAADDASPSRYPFWVLLDSIAYLADRDNATTVKGRASTGHEFKVSFCLADPPAVSYFCVHFPGISIHEVCTTEPCVVSSAKDLVLLCFAFKTNPPSTDEDSQHLEYFVYKAAPGGKHTIRPVPCSPPAYKHSWHAAIVPREGDNFLVANLSPNGEDIGHYNLHIFSSETNEWSTKHLQLGRPLARHVLPWDLPSQTDKVITIGESIVGWVDLWRGIVVCDVLEKDPILCFLPLPKADFDLHRESRARQVRDVIGFPNGFINFVEIEHCVRWLTVVRKSTSTDIIYDAELLNHDDMDVTDDQPYYEPAGWKIRTMLRSIFWNYWHKSHIVHVDEVSAFPPAPSKLHHHLWNGKDNKWTLGNLKTTSFPTFSVYGGNVVYLVSKVESQEEDTLLVGVDIGKKKLEVIDQYCCGRSISFDPIPLLGVAIVKKREVTEPYCGGRSTSFDPISCAFSEYLNTTPSPRPCDEEVAAESAQSGALNDHLSFGNIVPNKVQTQQNMWSGDDGAHPGYYVKYHQSTPF
ncbi:hypothetical protein ACQJBY_023088 [Aegilops geniculata]